MNTDSRRSELDELVTRADLDGLVRHVDATCTARDWDHLVRVRDRSRAAVETGRQLWPIATLANHRLALWAPAPWAVRSLEDSVRTFMPGPVSEILSVHHTWEELSPHLPHGHDRVLVAHERALRGDVVDEDSDMLDVPVRISPWEPRYVVATYTDDGVDCPAPDPRTVFTPCDITEEAQELDDPDTVAAFRRLVEPWTSQSNGTARAVVAEGGPGAARAAFGLAGARCSPITATDGVAWLAWAGASGGAHGKRRGAATGRAEAWWFLASFTGLAEQWPCDPAELGRVVESLRFETWIDDTTTETGWYLRLAIMDPEEGISVALEALDRA